MQYASALQEQLYKKGPRYGGAPVAPTDSQNPYGARSTYSGRGYGNG